MEVEFLFNRNGQLIPNVIPTDTTHLTFGWGFNQKIEPSVFQTCPNLTHIYFGNQYNQLIDNGTLQVCKKLTHLDFGIAFNQPLLINGKSILPNSLKVINFGNKIIIEHKAFIDIHASICVLEKITEYEIEAGHTSVNYKYIPIGDELTILNMIDAILPMPIADEIVQHIFDELPNIV